MPYHVGYITNEVNSEALPVAKITKYPLETADYKPFAQCILCAVPTGLWLRMWAFEVFSSPQSELRGVFRLFGDNAAALHVRARADTPVFADAWIETAGEESIHIPVSSHPHNGEDLQGVYWGAQVFISYEHLSPITGFTKLVPGVKFFGNFYKLRTDEPYVHMGSYYPADFSTNSQFDGLDLFEVISW